MRAGGSLCGGDPHGRRALCTMAALLAIAASATGCMPKVDEVAVDTRYPSPHQPLRATTRRLDPKLTLSTVLEGDAIHASVRRQIDCETITQTPMDRERGVRRNLRNGTLAQITNIGLGALMIGGGIATYAAPGKCAESGPCSTADKERDDTRKTTGLVVAGAAVLPITAAIWNAIRAKDDVESTPIAPAEERVVAVCARPPAEAAVVTVQVGSHTASGVTDATGNVRIQMAWITSSEDSPDVAQVSARAVNGAEATNTISLGSLPAYQAWASNKSEHESRVTASRMAEQAMLREKEAQEQAARETKVRALNAMCAKKRPDSCFELGQLLSPRNPVEGDDGIRFLEQACALRHPRACAEARSRMETMQIARREAAERQRRREAEIATEEAERRAAQAERAAEAAQVLASGRTIVASQLKAPATAQFSNDRVLFSCSSGAVATIHTVDAQNGFGAYLRETHCAIFNMTTRRTILLPDACDSVEYVARGKTSDQNCAHWTGVIQNATFTGARF